jgi:tetratricopeptide (TPR) repeat protein
LRRLARIGSGLTMSAAAAGTEMSVKNVTAFAAYLRGWLARAPGSQGASRDGRGGIPGIAPPGPGYAPAHAGLCEAYLRVYERDDAMTDVARAGEIELRRSDQLDVNCLRREIALAARRILRRAHEEAIGWVSAALKLRNREARSLARIARRVSLGRQDAEAEWNVRSAIARSPGVLGWPQCLGVFYSRLGVIPRRKELPHDIELVPTAMRAYRNLGRRSLQHGRVDDAIAMSRRSLESQALAETFQMSARLNSRGATTSKRRSITRRRSAQFTVIICFWGNLADACTDGSGLAERGIEAYRRALQLRNRSSRSIRETLNCGPVPRPICWARRSHSGTL